MGLIKRVLSRTSRKLLAKIAPSVAQHQLVLNQSVEAGDQEPSPIGSGRGGRSNKRLRKLRKSHLKDSAMTEALLLAAKNYLPPVQFHHVHGPNAQLSKNKCVARRKQSFCQALVFSNRVILPNERVYIKVLEISKGWSGTIRFGFTSVDPATLAYRMPKHACPDMTNAGHTWARALADEVVRRNSVIHFSYTKNGYIHYGINNQDCGIFHANVNTNQNLWFIIDIYGLTSAVELIDPRVHNATSELDLSQIDEELHRDPRMMNELFGRQSRVTNSPNTRRQKQKRARKIAARQAEWLAGGNRADRFVNFPTMPGDPYTQLPNLSSIMLPNAQQNIYSPMPVAAPASAAVANNRIPQLAADALDYNQSLSSIYSSDYLPIEPTSRTPRTINSTYSSLVNSNSPTRISASTSRLETSQTANDEQRLCQRLEQVQLSHHLPGQIAHKQHALKSTSANNVVDQPQVPVAAARRMQQQQQSIAIQTNVQRTTNKREQASQFAHRTGSNKQQPTSAAGQTLQPAKVSTHSANSSLNNQSSVKIKSQQSIKPQKVSAARDGHPNNSPPTKDCPICFERPINCVLYQCGHMCTCYECGVKQWKTQSRTCPICRTVIKDVIKTYMS